MSTVPEKTHLATPGQTVGPFFAFGLEYPKMHEVVFPHCPGAIVLGGTVYDGAGQPIPDALIEIWGADADGTVPRARGAFRRDDHTFTGFGRAATTDDGHYEFWTRNPGSVGGEAPFFAAIVFARGLPDKLHTRIYLPEDASGSPPTRCCPRSRRGARYPHRDAHARRRTPPRHPAAGREGDRVPCLLTGPPSMSACSRR